MALPEFLQNNLRVPVVGSPLFLVSGPELVIAQCKSGIIGSFPALNARPAEVLDEWLTRINTELESDSDCKPMLATIPKGLVLYGVSLVVPSVCLYLYYTVNRA